MGKLQEKLKRFGKIAALSTLGILPSTDSSQKQKSDTANTKLTEISAIPPQANDLIDVIEFKTSPSQTFQVDTISDPEIIQQINEGTYDGSLGHYNAVSNTTTINYFKGADYQPAEEQKSTILAHEAAHAKQANLYGEPIGIITPNQNYSLKIANEFNGYFAETVHELNISAKEGQVLGMNHSANSRFGDMLEAGFLQHYTSGNQQDMQEFLSAMTNTIFEDTYDMMVKSELYTNQMLDAAAYNSDITGYPEDIKRTNFEQAVHNAFTVDMTDLEGNPYTVCLYDYLTDENKALLETVAPQHQERMAEINAKTEQQIAENTAKRLTDWDKEASEIASAQGADKADILQQFQAEFEDDARTFTFPQDPQYRMHDAENHVSEVLEMPEYDAAIHSAEIINSETPIDNKINDNTLALNNVRDKLQQLHQRKHTTPQILADESAVKTFKTRISKQDHPRFEQTDSRNL